MTVSSSTGTSAPTETIDDAQWHAVWSQLNASRIWIFICATLLASGAFLVVLVGLTTLALSSPAAWADVALSFFAFSSLYIIPSILLYRYGLRIRAAVQTRSTKQLLIALRIKAIFWRFASTVVVIYMLLLGISAVITHAGSIKSFR